MNYFVALFLIGLAILAHEFGHFLVARLVKIPIRAFSIGFGPAVWKKQIGGTEYRVAVFPIGGYVMPAIATKEDYFKIPAVKRIGMAAGGPVASALLPLICFALLNSISQGLSFQGIFITPFIQTYSTVCNLIVGIPQIFTAKDELSGVIGMVTLGGNYINIHPLHTLVFLAVISLNLFILNLLPIPALDGGKILLHTAETIHPVFLRLHFPLSIAGWLIIIGLTIFTFFIDIKRLIT